MIKTKKIVKTLLLVLLGILVISICYLGIRWWYFISTRTTPPPPPKTHQEFKTNYTEEEHIERISNITEKFIEKDWFRYNYATVVDYDIEIMYSFYDNDPEYFILTYYLEKPWTTIEEDYVPLFRKHPEIAEPYVCHAYGAIVDDEYKIMNANGWWWNQFIYEGFWPGRNIFEAMGYGDCKKFYGNKCFGIENEQGEIVQIYSYDVCEMKQVDEEGKKTVSFTPTYNYYCHLYNEEEPICDKCYKQRVLTLEEQKSLMGWGMEDWKFDDYIYTNKINVRPW